MFVVGVCKREQMCNSFKELSDFICNEASIKELNFEWNKPIHAIKYEWTHQIEFSNCIHNFKHLNYL